MDTQDRKTDRVPLAVDLDGTLCRTDTLHEALLALVREKPSVLLQMPGWLKGGRAAFKAEVAARRVLRANELPLNEEVVDLVKAARADGRRTVLVSAAHEDQVKAVAEDTGLFDDAVGSTEELNLKGQAKAEYLLETYGESGFDYAGDGAPDLPVWRHARTAITVNARARVRVSSETPGGEVRHLGGTETVGALWRAVRPHQWLKNLLVFMPVLAAHDLSKLGWAALGFVAFCLIASSAYLINDLLDLHADRAHPRKRERPFASGRLPLATGIGASLGLLLAGLAIPVVAGNIPLLGVVSGYFAITLLYSFWLKRKLIVDILTLAGLYTIRIIGGGAATETELSPWMLGFSVFLFLCLAAIKRQAEIIDSAASEATIAGRAYAPSDLPIVRGNAIAAAYAAVLIFALYISSDDVRALYTRPELLWFVCPVLLYWLLRMIMKTHRAEMTDDPIVFAVRDRIGLVLIGICVAIVGLAAA